MIFGKEKISVWRNNFMTGSRIFSRKTEDILYFKLAVIEND